MDSYNEGRLGDIQKVGSTSSTSGGEDYECEVGQEEVEDRASEESLGTPISPGFSARTASSLTLRNTTLGTISALSTPVGGKFTPHNIPLQTKSVCPSLPRTLCQKYPSVYAKSRSNLLPLISPQCRSKRTNNLLPPRIPDTRCSLRMSTEWKTNRFAGGTYVHYPSRTVASHWTCECRTHRNSITNRLKPIEKSLIPSTSAAGDHLPISSESRKSNTCVLPSLSRLSEFDRCRSTNGRRWSSDIGGLKIPERTYFSSPRVKNTDQVMSRRPYGDKRGRSDQFFDTNPDLAMHYTQSFD
ncbi:hypothetical protein Aperf_G00000077794 [Anoplocephala perfoliata]